MKTFATLFSGGEGVGVGLQAAGLQHVWGVEYDPAIAAVAQTNGFDVTVADVRVVDYAAMPRVDWLHASPSCTRASVANANATEAQEDIEAAQAVCRALAAQEPEVFTLENVELAMPENGSHSEELRRKVYDAQQEAHRLARRLEEAGADADITALAEQLAAAQAQVVAAEQALAAAKKQADAAGQVVESSSEVTRTRSLATTGLSIAVQLQMASVPTAIYHLLNADDYPLVKCTVTTTARQKRVRITAYIEGYSSKAIDTVEVKYNEKPPTVVALQPTLFPDKVRTLNEVTRASLNVLGEDLETGKIEVHKTMPVWLLARTSVPLATYNPADDTWQDMSRYLGAFVTPNQPEVMQFLRTVAGKHAAARLVGYQDNADVEAQVQAIFEALKSEAGILYVNSVRDFNPDTGVKSQRLRLPAESLRTRQANCVDGAVLFASLLEALSLNPAIIVLPLHVIVGWETAPDSGQWQYLDTTKLDKTFAEALKFGSTLAKVMEKQRADTNNEEWFRRWPLRDLRSTHGIYPTE